MSLRTIKSAAASAAPSTPENKRTKQSGSGNSSLTQIIADDYDLSADYVNLLFNPESMNDANKQAAAGGTDKRTAQRPVLLRQPGDRMPTAFELRNQAFYDPSREPIVGEGGKTLNPNDTSMEGIYDFILNGYLPPVGSPTRAAMEKEFTPGYGTLQNAINQLGLTSQLGQSPVEYNPSNFTKLTAAEKAAIPFSGSVVFDRWNGGWTVAADTATSPNNFPAYQGNMVTDDPNFKYTQNPSNWIIPGVATVKSVPGSGSTVGFNTELGQWMTRPTEVGEKTTWELAATNPTTGQIDPGMVSRETAAMLKQYGNLPTEFEYLLTEGKNWGYWTKDTTTGGGGGTGGGNNGGGNNGTQLPKFTPTPVGKTPIKFLPGGGAAGRAGMTTGTPGPSAAATPTTTPVGRRDNTATTNNSGTATMPTPSTPTVAPGPTTNAGAATVKPVKTLDQILADQNAAILAAQRSGTMTGGMPNLKVKTGGR